MPISCILLLISYFLFPFSYFLFFISYFLFPIPYFLFPICYFLFPFPISYFLFPISYILTPKTKIEIITVYGFVGTYANSTQKYAYVELNICVNINASFVNKSPSATYRVVRESRTEKTYLCLCVRGCVCVRVYVHCTQKIHLKMFQMYFCNYSSLEKYTK